MAGKYDHHDKIDIISVNNKEDIDADVIQNINILTKPENIENIRQTIEFQFGVLYSLLKQAHHFKENEYFSSEFEIALDSLFKAMVLSDKEYTLSDMYDVLINEKVQEEFIAEIELDESTTYKRENLELVVDLYDNEELIHYLKSIISKDIVFKIDTDKQISMCGMKDVSEVNDHAFLLIT